LLENSLVHVVIPTGSRPETGASGFEKTGDRGKIAAMNSFLFALVQRGAFPEVLVDRDG